MEPNVVAGVANDSDVSLVAHGIEQAAEEASAADASCGYDESSTSAIGHALRVSRWQVCRTTTSGRRSRTAYDAR